jgi:hypothetical protein
MAETYEVELYASGPYVGWESTELVDLSDYGYTDEDWESLHEWEQGELLEEWGQDFFWSQGYEYNAEVKKNG